MGKIVKRWQKRGYVSQKFIKNILITIFLLFISAIFSWLASKNNFFAYFWKIDFAISFSMRCIIGILFYIILENIDLNRENKEYIENRMGKIIEYFALGTGQNGKLETIINHIRNKGKIRWLVAKFISEKLRKAFDCDEHTIIISSQTIEEFQDILDEIITDCEKNIYWTCPFTPKTWVDNVLRTKYSKDKLFKDLNLDDLPLLRSFSSSPVEKFRIVNLDETDFNYISGKNLISNDRDILFEELSYFIKLNELKISHCKLLFIDLSKKTEQFRKNLLKKDFGIYDEEVIISFEKDPNEQGDKGDIKLILGCQNISQVLNELSLINKGTDRSGIYNYIDLLREFKSNTGYNVEEKFKEFTGIQINF